MLAPQLGDRFTINLHAHALSPAEPIHNAQNNYREYLVISISAYMDLISIYKNKNVLGNKVDKTRAQWFNSYAHSVGFGISSSPKCANHIF